MGTMEGMTMQDEFTQERRARLRAMQRSYLAGWAFNLLLAVGIWAMLFYFAYYTASWLY